MGDSNEITNLSVVLRASSNDAVKHINKVVYRRIRNILNLNSTFFFIIKIV